MTKPTLLYFSEEANQAIELAALCNASAQLIERHVFPDGELKLRLPSQLPERVAIFHSFHHPNQKLIELLLAAPTAKNMGARHLTLIAPYLAYMRQDMAFLPGEAVSQQIIGALLATLFDALITVDPHLHRVSSLSQAVPVKSALVLSAAPLMGDFAAKQRANPILMGPDEESLQWVVQAAAQHHLDYAVAKKVRTGDRDVEVTLPSMSVKGRAVILLDDIASSGHTLARATELLLQAGAQSVDVIVTHALFMGPALELVKLAGVSEVWSTDCIDHPSNAISMLPAMAQAWNSLKEQS